MKEKDDIYAELYGILGIREEDDGPEIIKRFESAAKEITNGIDKFDFLLWINSKIVVSKNEKESSASSETEKFEIICKKIDVTLETPLDVVIRRYDSIIGFNAVPLGNCKAPQKHHFITWFQENSKKHTEEEETFFDSLSHYEILNPNDPPHLGNIREAFFKEIAEIKENLVVRNGKLVDSDELDHLYAILESNAVLSNVFYRMAYDEELAAGKKKQRFDHYKISAEKMLEKKERREFQKRHGKSYEEMQKEYAYPENELDSNSLQEGILGLQEFNKFLNILFQNISKSLSESGNNKAEEIKKLLQSAISQLNIARSGQLAKYKKQSQKN